MKVLALAADHDGCYQYRVRLPVEAAQRQGFDVTYDHNVAADIKVDNRTFMTRVDSVNTDADVISIQRPVTQQMHALAIAIKRQGIGLVVDLDDDLGALPKYNSAYASVDPVRSPLSNHQWLSKTTALADVVTVSAASLLRYAAPGCGRVVYNAVDPQWLSIAPALPATYGWAGALGTHRYDLHSVRSGMAGLDNDATLHVITTQPDVAARFLGWRGQVTCSGWQDFGSYPREMAARIGVGLVPLDTADVFNTSKSFLKGLEYAALGIPFVASPTAQYGLLAGGYRIGETAKSPGQWARKLAAAMSRREVLGAAYRDRVAAEHTTDHTAAAWIAAWEQAVT